MRDTRAPALMLALAFSGALLAGTATAASAVTISPLNGTPDASPGTQISFLGASAKEISSVSVTGSRSGSHSGALRSYASAAGASFVPARGFVEGERVAATALVGRRGHQARVGTTFYIARLVSYPLPAGRTPPPAKAGANQSFVTQPTLHPPTVRITTTTPAAAPGDIFLTTNSGRGQNGALIINGAGQLVWFKPAATGNAMTNLQVASYEGKPVLAYWEGHIDLGVGFGSDTLLGSDYKPVATIHAGNGYYADLHELQLTPQGSAYLTAYTLVRADLRSVGGSKDGALQDPVVQIVDVKTGLVMFEWHTYGHVALDDCYVTGPTDPNRPWDFFHLNSIEPDPWGDGNFLISSRNTWAVYEVNRQSGAVEWRLGGKHPSFRMGAGTGTAFQHDARWQPDHTITIFDNGAEPKAHSYSRAIHEQIDFKHRTVNLIGRDVRTPPLLSASQGNDQALGNGDWFVGWGQSPYFTEFNAAGQTVFDAHLPSPAQVYRSYRFEWNAVPAALPSIALQAAAAATTVYASWNGATGVHSWRVLAGPSPAALATVAEAPSSGFETAVTVPSAEPVFAVQALGPAGEVLGSSHAIPR
ncbi:MAG: arylsulfotransferase family protein [Solirubrobacterales bacterium]